MVKKEHLHPLGPLTEFDQFKKDIIPGYIIDEQLGKGASGIVFSALDEKKDKPVALKIFYLYYSKNKDFVRRLIREAETMKKIRHPNIVAGYGYGRYSGYYYTVMELVVGEPLSSIRKRLKKLDEKDAAKIILQCVRGLGAANQKKIIHRDIKPSNIMMTEKGVPKITDFGMAREELDTALTIPGTILGTPLYISPEQARGEQNLDIRSDIYALGITFYCLLTGKPPFSDLNTSLLLTKKITDHIPSPSIMNPSLSKEISAIIMKMCEREKMNRYKNPEELAMDLEMYLEGKFEVGATRIIGPKVKKRLSQEEIDEIVKDEIRDETLRNLLKDSDMKIAGRVLEESEILFYEEDPSRECYLLLKGAVDILKAGRSIAVIDKPGSFLGEMSTLLQTKRTATVRALNRAVLLEVPEGTFQQFLSSAPRLGVDLSRSLASRLQNTTDKLKEAQSKLESIREHYMFIREELELPGDRSLNE